MGHEVVDLWPDAPLFDLAAELDRRDFAPELILQEERLGRRVTLLGLSRFSCPKLYWSLDTHLNLFWQRFYLRLFDGVLTPHLSLLERRADMPPAVGRMAMFAQPRPFVPFALRRIPVGLVARLTPQRPARRWLAEMLAGRFGAVVAQDLSFADMLDRYADTRLAPNESLLGEVNFRLMETAGCGCLVLSPDVGPDQDALFEPGREIATYSHGLELAALIDHYLARPEEAERMGRAAWERVQRSHLPRRRAERALEFAATLGCGAARGVDAETALLLALCEMWRGGVTEANPRALVATLERLPATPEIVAERLILLVEAGLANGEADGGEAARIFLRELLAGAVFAGDLDVDLTGSMAGVLLDDFGLARAFWLRRVMAARHDQSGPAGQLGRGGLGRQAGGPRPSPPGDPARLCRWWAGELAAAGRIGSDGFPFDPASRLPRSAMECLHLALRLDPEDSEAARRLDALAATLPGRDYLRLSLLSTLTLRGPEDWRAGLGLGLAGLKCCRLDAGLADIARAAELARTQGRAASFARALAARDPRGVVAAALRENPGGA